MLFTKSFLVVLLSVTGALAATNDAAAPADRPRLGPGPVVVNPGGPNRPVTNPGGPNRPVDYRGDRDHRGDNRDHRGDFRDHRDRDHGYRGYLTKRAVESDGPRLGHGPVVVPGGPFDNRGDRDRDHRDRDNRDHRDRDNRDHRDRDYRDRDHRDRDHGYRGY